MSAKYLKSWAFLFFAFMLSLSVWAKETNSPGWIAVRDLPEEARITLMLIKDNKPTPYPKDGVVFGNYEGVLPRQRRGYYHEYTVKTPGVRSRGARRIIVGGDRDRLRQYYYTADHYGSFQRIKE